MINLVFSIGFTAEHGIKAVTERGLQDISSVYLFSAWEENDYRRKQSEDTISNIARYLSALSVKYITKYLDVNKDFGKILLDIASTLSSTDNLEFYLIGGARVINLALYYYALAYKNLGKNVKVFSYSEDLTKKYEVLLSIPAKVTESQFEIIKTLRYGEMEIEELAEKLGKSLPTISKQTSDLEEKGYIICTKTRPKRCKLSQLGEMMANTK